MQSAPIPHDLDTIRSVIRSLIADVAGLPPGAVTDDVGLDEIGIDSLLIVEVVVGIQRELGVGVPPSEFRVDIRTVGDVCDLLGNYVARAGAAAA